MTDKYGETNTNPYVDKLTTTKQKTSILRLLNVEIRLYYQVWLDTTKFSANNKENVQSVGITDDFDES